MSSSLSMSLLQTYLQSLTIRLEEMRVKRRDSEQWMHHRLLPQDLRERVRRYDQYKWLETRGVDEESLVQTLPKDLRRDIKRHLCLGLVRRVRSSQSALVLRVTSCLWFFGDRCLCSRTWTSDCSTPYAKDSSPVCTPRTPTS